jgi:hypothetical protein
MKFLRKISAATAEGVEVPGTLGGKMAGYMAKATGTEYGQALELGQLRRLIAVSSTVCAAA